ncbi:pirin family protein [Rheinheimera texasensis]|uniref:pirin family protein n=1 Tax=Rheinheimera texasensis TaxID=306205 RepID=UPI0032B1B86A
MSNLTQDTRGECNEAAGCGAIVKIIQPREKDLGGFSVRRLLPVAGQQMVGPWIFFDHMGPAFFSAGSGIKVRPHPHINLATVTYLFEGEILHRDSLGSLQPIRPGDINLMVAGRGIVHSERERPEVTAVDHQLHGLQLWLVLPEADEETEPAFYHYPAADIPALDVEGVPVRVIMGSAYGQTSPVKQFAPTLYIEASLKAGQQLVLPQAPERALYIAAGAVKARDTKLKQYEMAVLDADTVVTIEAVSDSRVALIGGAAMARRYIEWNFVSSRRERIEQAKADWQQGNFPKVPGDEDEFIPLP